MPKLVAAQRAVFLGFVAEVLCGAKSPIQRTIHKARNPFDGINNTLVFLLAERQSSKHQNGVYS